MKYISLFFLVAVVCSCNNNESFINHNVEYKKIGDCSAGEKTINMTSNIAGERYQFEACLNSNFAGDAYTVERKNDSLVVSFQRVDGEKAAFEITLDIDAFPVYDHIVIDGHEAIEIKHVEK
ncbi:MAG: hypothetical protein V4685_14210 [Bacteroidota bacterium]